MKLQDYFAPGWALQEARGDPKSMVIEHVKVLGNRSENDRQYLESTIREAKSLYDGVGVHIGHASGGKKHSYDDLIARLGQPRVVDGELYADLHVVDSGPRGKKLIRLSEQAPHLVGLSHEARGSLDQQRGGPDIVREISEVRAVAVVLDPASTSGLHESAEVVELLEHIQEDAMDLRDPDREPDVYDYHLREQRRQKAERRAEHDDPRQADLGKVARGLFGQSAEVLEEEDIAEVEMNLFV